jgi:hypothetical protein
LRSSAVRPHVSSRKVRHAPSLRFTVSWNLPAAIVASSPTILIRAWLKYSLREASRPRSRIVHARSSEFAGVDHAAAPNFAMYAVRTSPQRFVCSASLPQNAAFVAAIGSVESYSLLAVAASPDCTAARNAWISDSGVL